MTDYTKSTNFASKDSLPSGNALKIVKGTEIDTEFNNIATAIATKADLASPALTGTPTAPTAAVGTNTTQIATAALVFATLQAVYPVGSVYINASSTTNPATLLGFGTWTAFGTGRVLVGQDTGDTSFDVLEETGGSKDAVVVSHTHTDSGHTHAYSGNVSPSNTFQYSGGGGTSGIGTPYNAGSTTSSGTANISTTGVSGTNANLQPYVVVKMWKRTA